MTTSLPVTLEHVQSAAERIRGRVRRTPMFFPAPLREPLPYPLWLKLESLQITGSFKARGATNKVMTLDDDALARGLVTASGGNHGLGVAYAGSQRGQPATVFISRHVPEYKARKLRSWGARVAVEGEVWDDANEAALEYAERSGAAYVHPFSDPHVIAGQGTIGLEILEDLPEVDTVIVAVGGGGLISGVSVAIKALRPGVRVVGVEPAGAPTITTSLREGKVVAVDEIRTAASSLAGRMTTQFVLDIVSQTMDELVLVTDAEMVVGARWLWREFGLGAEIGGSAAVGALLMGKIAVQPGERVCAIVCGAGDDGREDQD